MDHYSVKLMNRAQRDLDGIYAYIARTLLAPGTAVKLIDQIAEEMLSLEQMPYRCPERKNGAYANRGYRQLLIGNFTAVYRVDTAKKLVIIVTVRYSRSQF